MAIACTTSLSFHSHLHLPHHHHRLPHFFTHKDLNFTPKFSHPFVLSPRYNTSTLLVPLSTSQSSSDSIPLSNNRTGSFLTNQELEKLQFLETYRYYQELKSGLLYIRVMKQEELDMTAGLLADSFAESMYLPKGYVRFLEFLVKQYLVERRTLMPHNSTLVAFFKEDQEEDLQLAGTVEVFFDKKGASASPPSPAPPKNSPYICNMAVKKSLRRKGIGWHLLKASEQLILQMTSSRDVYLHCRMIDEVPLSMYLKAGYNIVKTDNVLILLTLQRRKHLMCKQIPVLTVPSETDVYSQEPL